MASIESIRIELKGIGRILFNRNLCVPLYQRSYAWEESHVLDLFNDIQGAMAAGEHEYFIGTIVTTKNRTDRPEIADGQQRLATATILLAAIRDCFHDNGDHDRAETITSDLLHKKELKTLELIPKLKLNDGDHDFFVKRILLNPNNPDRDQSPAKLSHIRIEKAAELAKQHVLNLASMPDSTERLTDLVSYLTDSVVVIWVKVPDDTNAFTIFETLNDRGLSLAISDLLKNFLFGLSCSRLPEVQRSWTSMVSALESIEDERIVVTFIRHFWSSKHGLVREKELYNSIKRKISSTTAAVSFARDLERNAQLYAAILNTKDGLWNKYGMTCQRHMEVINLLRMAQIRPLILAVLDKFAVKEVRTTIRNMVSWSVRFLVHGGVGGGTLENHYSQAAKEVRAGKLKTGTSLFKRLKPIVPTNAQFRSSFMTATVSKAYLARYYLRALEQRHIGEKEPELIPNDDSGVVNLEHVLPQNPSNAWNHLSPDDQAVLVRTLGNLALLKNRINVRAGNDSFSYKKAFYAKSKFELTNMIATERTWNQETIQKRQSELAKLAVKAWPLK
ncbi:MAG: DUF262 domain-containing HNH endonuclease family protein [Thermodesulfobacteriota bacterium]|nr:DUF262 domain-containing HNH endonuclease family protein [Thermodesulfobacteriota bacterium]